MNFHAIFFKSGVPSRCDDHIYPLVSLVFWFICVCHPQVFLVDNSIHSVVRCANYYGLFSLDEIEAESKVSTPHGVASCTEIPVVVF